MFDFPSGTKAFLPWDDLALSPPNPEGSRLLLRAALAAAILAATLSTSGCLLQKKHARVFVPLPVQQHPPPAPLTLPANLDPPELILEAETADFDSASLTPVPEFAPPAPPPRSPRPRSPVVTAPRPVPAPVQETPAPKIVQLFPAEQQRAYNRELDEILGRDQKALETMARRNLAADQRDRMAQIQELLTQAKQAREQDLVTAVSLARRADTLAKDLLDRLP